MSEVLHLYRFEPIIYIANRIIKKKTILNMNLEFSRERKIDETIHYESFSKDIDYLTEFFSDLFTLLQLNGKIKSFLSVDKHYFLSDELIKSSSQTLKSIKFCCSIGSFSDANTLIRKLRDDLIQYLWILTVIEGRKSFTAESMKVLNFNNPDELTKSFLNLQYNEILTDDEKALTSWFKNSISDLKRPERKKLEFENYMKVLKQNKNISQILIEYNLEEYWNNLRIRLNNYVHNNGIQFSKDNFISANDKNLETHLKNVNFRVTYISSIFLSLLLMIDSSLTSSTDYIDHLEFDMEPPQDSQYFLAPFIQNFIDEKVYKLHPELKKYLKDNNIHGMRIE